MNRPESNGWANLASKKHLKTCAYCGRLSHDWTIDHVAPQCLWDDRPLSADVLKVPTCLTCNNFWSADEGYFRSMMAFYAIKGGHPIVTDMIQGTVKSHWNRDNKFRRNIVESVAIVPKFTPTGLYVGHGPTVDMEWDRWLRVAGKIVRGLFFVEHRRHVPDDHVVYVWRGEDFWQDVRVMRIIEQLPKDFSGFGNKEDGNADVFIVKRAPASDDPDGMCYLMAFYGVVSMFATVIPAKAANFPDPSHPTRVAMELEARRL